MNVSAEEIRAAVTDDTSPLSAGEEMPSAGEGNGAARPERSPAPSDSASDSA